MNKDVKKYVAEFVGTMILVLIACGAAVFFAQDSPLTVAFAFGLVIVAMAYSIGTVSGCHINPAVSLAMLINKRITVKDFIYYVISQVLGAMVGAGILYVLFNNSMTPAVVGNLGQNGIGNLTIVAALVTEIILTFVFVTTILAVTGKKGNAKIAGVVIGLTLVLVHIIGIPLTGTSVNPARSIGPALFIGGTALSELWIFIVGPLVGAAIAACFSKHVLDTEKEEK